MEMAEGEASGIWERVADNESKSSKVLSFKYNGNTYTFDRKNLQDMLSELRSVASTKITALQPAMKDKLQHINEVAKMVYRNNQLHNILVSDVKQAFSGIGSNEPGSVAAYFLNCFTDAQYAGGMGCNAMCALSLKPYEYCDEGVYYLSNGRLEVINGKLTSHVYVYTDTDPYWLADTVSQLQAQGVEKVTLTVEKPGQEAIVYSELTLEQLPRLATPVTEPVTEISPTRVEKTKKKADNPLYIVVLLLLLLILVALSTGYDLLII
jgi:hypothetical protein